METGFGETLTEYMGSNMWPMEEMNRVICPWNCLMHDSIPA